MNKFQAGICVALLFLSIFSSCKRRNINIFRAGESEIESFLVKEIDFEYFSSRAKVNYLEGGNKLNFTANIRMKKDSIIWLSATAALGIEAVRAVITKDSVFIMNRLENSYSEYSTDYFRQKFNVDLSLVNLQNIILGNLLIPKRKSDKLIRDQDPACIILEQNEAPVVVQNFVTPETMKVTRITVAEETGASITIDYEDFKPLESFLFPAKNTIKAIIPAQTSKREVEVTVNHNKIELGNKSLSFPFNVPAKYDAQSR